MVIYHELLTKHLNSRIQEARILVTHEYARTPESCNNVLKNKSRGWIRSEIFHQFGLFPYQQILYHGHDIVRDCSTHRNINWSKKIYHPFLKMAPLQ